MELAEIEPKFLRHNMPAVIEQMYTIAESAALEDGTRRLAIEVLIVICEEAAAMARKFPTLCQKLVPLLINFCTEIEEDDTWSKQDDDDYTDEDLNSTVGEQSLDRLACAIGGNIILPECYKYLPTLLQSENWKERAAALSTVAAIAEGCLDQLRASLADIVNAVVPLLLDPVCVASALLRPCDRATIPVLPHAAFAEAPPALGGHMYMYIWYIMVYNIKCPAQYAQANQDPPSYRWFVSLLVAFGVYFIQHPRVRYAACNAVGQLSLDFAPQHGKEHQQCFQTMFHTTVCTALLADLPRQPVPVQLATTTPCWFRHWAPLICAS